MLQLRRHDVVVAVQGDELRVAEVVRDLVVAQAADGELHLGADAAHAPFPIFPAQTIAKTIAIFIGGIVFGGENASMMA